MSAALPLAGRRVLLVEDEYLIVREMVRALKEAGAEVIGPVATVAGALKLVEAAPEIDGAVLDINLGGELVYPVADALQARGVPYVFTTAYHRTMIPAAHDAAPHCEKPADPKRIIRALFG